MISKDLLGRAKLFYSYIQQPIFLVIDLLGDGANHWFIMHDFKESNPSSHIYSNELIGKEITHLVFDSMELDQISFLTKVDELQKLKIKFHPTVKWVQIKI